MELKPHLNWDAQLERLKTRGLEISDDAKAISLLQKHNFYRLSGYWHVFLSESWFKEGFEIYKPDTSLNDLMLLVEFDSKLRNVLFEALSIFELQLRSSFAYHGGAISPELHLTGEGLVFLGKQSHSDWLQEYEKRVARMSDELFVRWHVENYDGKLPIWVAVEVLDFGAISKLFRSAAQGLAYSIANDFGCSPGLLKSWAASLNDLRNTVAHQTRLWNHVYPVGPKTNPKQLPDELKHLDWQADYDRHKIYSRLAILVWLDRDDRFGMKLKNRLLDVLEDFPKSRYLSLQQMGFPENWGTLPLWKGDS